MSAFDTSTNTASVSFTNAYSTAVLQPSAVGQEVFGFEQTTGKRYFEFYIDDGGGTYLTTDKPYVGILGYGASSNLLGPLVPGGATISTGDVFMFSVDFGGGTDHAGNVKYSTVTGVGGNLMYPVFVDIGKNGTWNTDLWGFVNWRYPAYGRTGGEKPALLRIPTSTSAVTISLRVQSTSFAYPIPSGFVAWGDGPPGAGPAVVDFTGGWDRGTIGSAQTLTFTNTGSFYYGHDNVTPLLSSSAVTVKSSILPLIGKRVFEIWGRTGATAGANIGRFGTSWSGTSPGRAQPTNMAFGFCDANLTRISYSALGLNTETNNIWWAGSGATAANSFWRRGITDSNIVNLQAAAPNQNFGDGLIFYVDFDAKRFWFRRGVGAANAMANGGWSGFTLSDVRGPDPFLGTDGLSLSESPGAGGIRFLMGMRRDVGAGLGLTAYLNCGQDPFFTYPLLPGWSSLDGSRRVEGIGAVWDTSIMPTSHSVGLMGLGVRSGAHVNDNSHCRTTTKFNSGKRYFEIFYERQIPVSIASLTNVFGLLKDGVTTLTAGSVQTSLGPVGIWATAGTNLGIQMLRLRYSSIVTNISQSATYASGLDTANATGVRVGCAVDFDAGKVWFGYWNAAKPAMAWAVGANPATGANPDFTFTACTTFYACAAPTRTTYAWTIFLGESGNLAGLPAGFTPWNGLSGQSLTATPSGTTDGGGGGGTQNIWPFGIVQ